MGARPREQAANRGIVGAGDQSIFGSEIFEELPEDRLIRRRIGKDVGVIPVDVREHRQLRCEVQKLRSTIEDRRSVLIALEDEFTPAAPGGGRSQIFRGHAQPKPGISTGAAQDPGDEAGGRRLTGRSRHHDPKAVGRQLTPVFRLADQPDVQPPGRLGFGIAFPHLVALNHQVRFSPSGHVARGVAVDPLDPSIRQDVRRRWIRVLVRAGDVVAKLLGHQRQPGDGITADADEVNPHQWRVTPSRRPATCAAAPGRPSDRMALTILLYRASS